MQENQENQSLMLVDGMALLFRGYFANSFRGYIRKTSDGLPTNAVFGFVKYFWDAIHTFRPSHVICCWDMGSKTFRNDLYAEYKANREAPPEELIPQFDLVKEVVASFDVPNIGLAGYEADDCIGTLAKHYGKQMKVQILTGDHDALQLVEDQIEVIIMKKGHSNYAVYNPAVLQEEMGITSQQLIDVKALMGDSSDNYPGVKGIGEKTAIKLVKEYGTIEGLLENLSELTPSVQKKINEDLDMLHLSRQLAQIRCDVPISCELGDCAWKMDSNKVLAQFELLEFNSLMKLIS